MDYIFINCKLYKNCFGKSLDELAKVVLKVQKDINNIKIILCVSPLDLERVCKKFKSVTFYIQHLDGVGFGRHTGHILPIQVKELGAVGTILNHSEKRLKKEEIELTVQKTKEVKLKVCLCVKDELEILKYNFLDVDFIAIEPPELIGGNISVSKANPKLISNSVKKSKKKLLVGAGIRNFEDVKIAKHLGSCGVLLASEIAKAKDKRKAILEIVKGFL